MQEAHGFFVGAAQQLINRFDELLEADGFARVQAAINPYDRFAFFAIVRELVLL